MATSSITKTFVINNDKAREKLIAACNNPSSAPKYESKNYYEEGKKTLAHYFGR